jgi:hypothetical protein
LKINLFHLTKLSYDQKNMVTNWKRHNWKYHKSNDILPLFLTFIKKKKEERKWTENNIIMKRHNITSPIFTIYKLLSSRKKTKKKSLWKINIYTRIERVTISLNTIEILSKVVSELIIIVTILLLRKVSILYVTIKSIDSQFWIWIILFIVL